MENSGVRMALNVPIFHNAESSGGHVGGEVLFKALGHPLAAPAGRALMQRLEKTGPVAIYDPDGIAASVHAYYDLSRINPAGYFVQRLDALPCRFLQMDARPVTALADSGATTVLVLAFDAERRMAPIRHLFSGEVVSLDAMRIDDTLLTNPRFYLDALNFATNFALFRDVAGDTPGDAATGLHTRITGANYWGLYGAESASLWMCLFGADGSELAVWRESLPAPGAPFEIDSRAVRERFSLGDFTGSLFMHGVGIAGHDVVKYALDIYGDHGRGLSCTHDANAWPADYYAGIPAGEKDERIVLYVQNSHPVAIPPGGITANVMGREESHGYDETIAPFATAAVDLNALLPGAGFPDQIEISAGRYFVRPRYEVTRGNGRRRIAHANVERTDLSPNPDLPGLSQSMGKGYIMPLPVPPLSDFSSVMLPTPMARSQADLPVRAELFDAGGERVAARFLGRIPRRDSIALDIDDWLTAEKAKLASGYGHVEFLYDFRDGGGGDGWLHALGRYEQRASGHRAETIFGAHIFNTALVYRDEPQSYKGPPPGLTTRLFVRLGGAGLETFCHLIYPASLPWHRESSTALILHDSSGKPVAEKQIAIPCGGSLFCRLDEIFTPAERATAGDPACVMVRDGTCRLFGFHGLLNGTESFCLDHLFGF